MGRENTKVYLPSFRAQRSNPSGRAKGEMDCFAALAMTNWARIRATRWLLAMTLRELKLLPPHLARDIDRQLQLGPLLFLGQDVAFLGRCKAALRRYRELV